MEPQDETHGDVPLPEGAIAIPLEWVPSPFAGLSEYAPPPEPVTRKPLIAWRGVSWVEGATLLAVALLGLGLRLSSAGGGWLYASGDTFPTHSAVVGWITGQSEAGLHYPFGQSLVSPLLAWLALPLAAVLHFFMDADQAVSRSLGILILGHALLFAFASWWWARRVAGRIAGMVATVLALLLPRLLVQSTYHVHWLSSD